MEEYMFAGQEWWGWVIAGYLFLGGLAGLTLVIAYYYWVTEKNKIMSLAGGLASFVSIVVGIILLLIDLGRPRNVMAMFTSPKLNLHSWMTIGTYIIVLFTIFSGLYTLPFIPGLGLLRKRNLRKYITTVGGIAAFLGLATAAYTGFLLSAARGVQFWNNPLLPVLFLASAMSSGLCFYCALVAPVLLKTSPSFREAAVRIRLALQRLDAYVILGELFILFAYLNISLWSQPGASESARRLISGDLAGAFWIGVVIVGLIIPFIILVGYTLRRKEETTPVIVMSSLAGWLTLIGALILRYLILHAGVIPAPLI